MVSATDAPDARSRMPSCVPQRGRTTRSNCPRRRRVTRCVSYLHTGMAVPWRHSVCHDAVVRGSRAMPPAAAAISVHISTVTVQCLEGLARTRYGIVETADAHTSLLHLAVACCASSAFFRETAGTTISTWVSDQDQASSPTRPTSELACKDFQPNDTSTLHPHRVTAETPTATEKTDRSWCITFDKRSFLSMASSTLPDFLALWRLPNVRVPRSDLSEARAL